MPHVRERTTKAGQSYWQVLWKIDGRQRSAVFHGKPALHRFLATVEEAGADAAIRGALDPDARPTDSPRLDHYLEQYIEELTDATVGTREGYRTLAQRSIVAEMGTPRLADITRSTVATAMNRLTARLAPKTVRNAHGFLSAALEQAFRDGIIPTNPARRIRLPKKAPATKRLMTQDELDGLAAALPEHYRPLVAVLAGTGMRWARRPRST